MIGVGGCVASQEGQQIVSRAPYVDVVFGPQTLHRLSDLLAEILPQEVCEWYLAIYVDAIEWVELPNTAGMALFANGGRFTSKPYIASGAYIKRMSNYCSSCKYKPEVRYGEEACPMTTLYWNFLIKHRDQFEASPRTRLMTANLKRISDEDQQKISIHAEHILNQLDSL